MRRDLVVGDQADEGEGIVPHGRQLRGDDGAEQTIRRGRAPEGLARGIAQDGVEIEDGGVGGGVEVAPVGGRIRGLGG